LVPFSLVTGNAVTRIATRCQQYIRSRESVSGIRDSHG